MATHWVIGDTVLLETARTAKYYGYALLADNESPFYVGITVAPDARLRQHVYSGVPLVRAKLAECKLKRLRILAGPMSGEEAREWEEATVEEMTGAGIKLVNQAARPKQPRGTVNQRHPAVLRFAGLESES